jgi:hypothetical protein
MAFGGMGNFNTATQASSVGQFRRWYMTNNQEGILGLYTGEFPITDPATGAVSARGTGTSSPNGWGMWAGTSFATGVVTGIFARAAQAGCVVSLKQPNNFYRGLESEGFPVTRYGELIVFTPQGQSAVLPGLFQWVVVIWNWLQTLVRPRSTKPTP